MLGSAAKKIIAIHGAGMNAAAFGSLAPHLTDYHFQALNLPGHDAHKDELGCDRRLVNKDGKWLVT